MTLQRIGKAYRTRRRRSRRKNDDILKIWMILTTGLGCECSMFVHTAHTQTHFPILYSLLLLLLLLFSSCVWFGEKNASRQNITLLSPNMKLELNTVFLFCVVKSCSSKQYWKLPKCNFDFTSVVVIMMPTQAALVDVRLVWLVCYSLFGSVYVVTQSPGALLHERSAPG